MRYWIVIILLCLWVAGFLTGRFGTPQVDQSMITKARKDSARYAIQVDSLQSEIRRSKQLTADSIQVYQKKIEDLEASNEAQIDSFFVVRYKQPITQFETKKSAAIDLVDFDRTRIELISCENVNSLQARMLKVKDDIIRSDSIQLVQIPGMEKEIKRLRRTIFWTKVGSGAAVVLILLVAV